MDKELRLKMYARIDLIHSSTGRFELSNNPIYLEETIQLFDQIQVKRMGDIEEIADVFTYLGNYYFNHKDFWKAAEYYNRGAQALHSIANLPDWKLEDSHYRDLILFYINLSDSFINLGNITSSDQAFQNAIFAYKQIVTKRESEMLDESNPDFFKLFRDKFERKCSTDSYVASRECLVNGEVLHDVHTENEMGSLVESMCIEVSSSGEAPNQGQTFTPITVDKTISDEEYRVAVRHFAEHGRQFVAQQMKKEAIEAFQKAEQAAEQIRVCDAEDVSWAELIAQQLRGLGVEKPANQDPLACLTHSIRHMSMFAVPEQPPAPPAAMYDPDEDERFFNNYYY